MSMSTLTTNLKKAIRDPRKAVLVARTRLLDRYVELYNALRRTPSSPAEVSSIQAFEEVRRRAQSRSDINEHLPRLFAESLRLRPRLIVELGVREGESTFVFERVARLCSATFVSVDIEDCLQASSYSNWHFVQSDDVAFARRFPDWCAERGLSAHVDVLFVDTSHLYEHTVQEIDVWFPLLAKHALVFFHDTNQRLIYSRDDKSIGQGWDNDRGVVRALEGYFNQSFNEQVDFTHVEPGWIIRHHSRCSGLTILEKIEMPAVVSESPDTADQRRVQSPDAADGASSTPEKLVAPVALTTGESRLPPAHLFGDEEIQTRGAPGHS